MANAYGLFWNSQSSDRTYDADSFSEWLQKFFTTGVFQNELQVTASSGMDVSVGTGYANINGKVRFFDTATTFTMDTADGSNPRIDTIVVERDDTNRIIQLKKVKGDLNGSNPSPKAPVRSGGIYQIVLAEIRVNAGVTAITTANITDKRPDSSVCGWVTGTVQQLDLSQIMAQSEAEIDAWFQNMKDQLSEDAAINLQNQIDALDDEVEDLQGATTITTGTMLVAGWNSTTKIYSFETDYPVASCDLEIELNGDALRAMSSTDADAVCDAWAAADIKGSASTNDVWAKGDLPTVALPIIIKATAKLGGGA